MDCTCIMFAIGIKARDELARKAGIKCADRGGGITIDNDLRTSDPNIYAIGECASWENQTFGLIAPGIEQADVLSFNLTQAKVHSPRTFKRPDLSTKLKLLGVEVASFGDFFADRDGPKDLPVRKHGSGAKNEGIVDGEDKVKAITNGPPPSPVKALTYKDPFRAVYKKYLFTLDGKYLLGGMMIGDTKDYVKLVPMVKNRNALEVPPSHFILGASKEGDDDASDLKSIVWSGCWANSAWSWKKFSMGCRVPSISAATIRSAGLNGGSAWRAEEGRRGWAGHWALRWPVRSRCRRR